MKPDAVTRWAWPERYDFGETTRLLRTGRNDPTVRRETDGLWRAARLPSGPATVRITIEPETSIEGRAWGPGADEALAQAPRWLGLDQRPWELPPHPVTDRLLRAHPGLRLTDTVNVFEGLINVVLQQQVTWNEAAYTWRRLVEHFGEPAPGPGGLGLLPDPRTLVAASVDRLVALGIGHQRARTLREIAFSASRLQRAETLPTGRAARLLESARGIGPWTSAMVLGLRLGRPEPIVIRDIHLPHTVCWALAGEPRGSDARMLELLAPFGDQAFRVVRLLFAARIEAPRRGPRRPTNFGRR